jgi:putative CocE/NonD family hydrolase
LTYETLDQPGSVEVTGPVKATLYISSSAKDTDFTVKLLDVTPDGDIFCITQGALRCRYREGYDNEVWMNEDSVYLVEIDLHATSYVFDSGHRIRVDISSSDFPRLTRSLNTAGDYYSDTTWIVAVNRIHHSRTYSSHILLPIIP